MLNDTVHLCCLVGAIGLSDNLVPLGLVYLVFHDTLLCNNRHENVLYLMHSLLGFRLIA
jgi:hypothetical protein